tara:strand:+ start:3396 stop:3626 length:231 start_codon:yes stop_codon:yes gene_type:complete
MKIDEIEKLKKIYTKARSKNKTLYACVMPHNNVGLIRDELTFVKNVFDNSFRIYRPLDNTIIEIKSKDLNSFKFIY